MTKKQLEDKLEKFVRAVEALSEARRKRHPQATYWTLNERKSLAILEALAKDRL